MLKMLLMMMIYDQLHDWVDVPLLLIADSRHNSLCATAFNSPAVNYLAVLNQSSAVQTVSLL